MTDKLTPLREQIDAIDAQILDLLNRRAKVAQEVGHVKAETNAPVFRPEREAQVLRGVADRNPGPMGNTEMQTIFREIMSACRSLEKRVTVAFLGPAGTYSEQAVYQQFGTAVDVLACSSIDEVFRATEAGTAEFGGAELLVDRLLTVGAGRAEEGDGDALFQRAAGRHDLAEDCLHLRVAHRAGIAVGHAAQHLRFALGAEHRGVGFGFDVADFLRHLGAAVQQVEDLRVDRVDLFT